MARWYTPGEADLRCYLSSQEIRNLKESLTEPGDADTVATVITNAVQYVRGKIAQNRINRLAAGNTVPKSLLRQTMAIAVLDVMSRPAAAIIDTNGARRDMAKVAEAQLELVAKGDPAAIRIEAPETAELDTEESTRWNMPGSISIVESKDALLTRDTMDGL